MRDLQKPGRSPVHARSAMAATSSTIATGVALDILKAGGNAMDAAIAACAVQCVVEPASTGIGGDNFCMYAPKGVEIVAYNGSGRAPAAASVERLRALGVTEIERTSGHAVVVPGAADAWIQLNSDHGRLPLADLLAPAIELARDGYPVASRVHADLLRLQGHIRTNERLSSIFLANGDVPAVGAKHTQPALARTLEAIASGGREAFYEGELARSMVDALNERGGLHTMADFAEARGEYVEPISTEYRGLQVHECPPNGQGVIALLLLNVMNGFDMGNDPMSADRVHLELEACRQAYAAREQFLADPATADVPVEYLLSEQFADQVRRRIDPRMVSTAEVPFEPPHADTVYISVVDAEGNACSFINTLFEGFGSGITTDTGIVLTNRAQGFVLDPNHPNRIEGGKRPLHTIIPAIGTRDGETELCFGVMGGQYQAFGQMQFLTRWLDFGADIQEAQDWPRWMVDPFTGVGEIETTMPGSVLDDLRGRGHRIDYAKAPIGGSQAIAFDRETGWLVGGSDPRKDGCAFGY